MGNIRKWLENAEAATGETIEAIVVGPHYNAPDKWSANPKVKADENRVLSREDGLKKLDQDYDDGYGGADCFPMYAWTKSRVYFIHEYDGSTGLSSVPRNPVDCSPEFSGGD